MDTNLAMLDLPIGGEATYGVRPIKSLEYEVAHPPHNGGRLRVFLLHMPGPDLSARTIQRLNRCAMDVVEQVTNQLSGGFWTMPNTGQRQPPRWFLCEPSRDVKALDTASVRHLAATWSEAPAKATKDDDHTGVLVELSQDPTASDSKQLMDDLRKSVGVFFDARVSKNPGYAPALIIRGAPAQRVDRESAVLQRNELLRLGWPDSKAVGVMLGSKPTGAEARASRERSAGRLLGAWAGRDTGYVHPEFQFLDSGTVNPRVADLLDAMANNAGLSAAQDKNGWQRVFWLYQPRGRLSKQAMALRRAAPEQLLSDPARLEKLEDAPRAPADVFPHDPQAVIDLAREDAQAQTPPDVHEGRDAAADA